MIEGVKDEALKDVGGQKVGRLVGEVMEKESWSVRIPLFFFFLGLGGRVRRN